MAYFYGIFENKEKNHIKSARYSRDLILRDQVAVGPGCTQHISIGSPLDPLVRYIGSDIGCYIALCWKNKLNFVSSSEFWATKFGVLAELGTRKIFRPLGVDYL